MLVALSEFGNFPGLMYAIKAQFALIVDNFLSDARVCIFGVAVEYLRVLLLFAGLSFQFDQVYEEVTQTDDILFGS